MVVFVTALGHAGGHISKPHNNLVPIASYERNGCLSRLERLRSGLNGPIRAHGAYRLAWPLDLETQVQVRLRNNSQEIMRHAEQHVFGVRTKKTGSIDFSGDWANELKSTMHLEIKGQVVSGTYTSHVSDSGGQTKPYPLSGTVSEDLLAFTVNWGGAITCWVGHGVRDDSGKPQILTLWQLVQNTDDPTDPEMQWKAILAGADTFSRAVV